MSLSNFIRVEIYNEKNTKSVKLQQKYFYQDYSCFSKWLFQRHLKQFKSCRILSYLLINSTVFFSIVLYSALSDYKKACFFFLFHIITWQWIMPSMKYNSLSLHYHNLLQLNVLYMTFNLETGNQSLLNVWLSLSSSNKC